MTSANIKKFFKRHFDIPVRVRTVAVKQPFVQVWISPNPGKLMDPLTYSHQFPDKLGNQLLRIIYGESQTAEQNWAGNIQPHRLSMSQQEWDSLTALYPEN